MAFRRSSIEGEWHGMNVRSYRSPIARDSPPPRVQHSREKFVGLDIPLIRQGSPKTIIYKNPKTPPRGTSPARSRSSPSSSSPQAQQNKAGSGGISPAATTAAASAAIIKFFETFSEKRQESQRCWQPPLYYQRRRVFNQMQFFPLELTCKDYAHRVLDTVAAGLRNKIETALLNSTAPTTNKPFAQESLKLVLPDPSSFALLRTVFSSISDEPQSLSHSQSSRGPAGSNQMEKETLADVIFPQKSVSDKFSSSVKTLLSIFTGIAFPDSMEETGQLYDMNDLFNAANEVLKLFSTDSTSSSSIVASMKELEELHQQVYSHMLYKNSRMSLNSWTYDGEAFDASTGMGGLHRARAAGNAADIDGGVSDDLIAHAQDVCMQMQGLMEPQNVSRAHLTRRILQAAEDVRVFASTACDNLNYDEGLRLRELGIKLEQVISDEDRQNVDAFGYILGTSRHVVSDLMREAEAYRSSLDLFDVDKIKRIEGLAQEVTHLRGALQDVVSDILYSKDEKEALVNIATEGTENITVDWLMSLPGKDGSTIAGLIIQAKAVGILEAMKETLSFGSGGEPESPTYPASSPGRVSGATRNVTSPTNKSSPKHAQGNSSTSSGWTGGGTISSPTTKKVLFPPSSTSAFPISSNNNNNYSPPLNMTMSAIQFQSLVSDSNSYTTIESLLSLADEAIDTLKVLLEPHAAAHTSLILRLIGCTNLLNWTITRCSHINDIDEDGRLRNLLSAVEATIDADEGDENKVPGGRGRQRLDSLALKRDQARRLSNTLLLEARRSRDLETRDYSSASFLDKASKELASLSDALNEGLVEYDMAQNCKYDWEDHLARDGSTFVTSDFLFCAVDQYDGHSIGSLALVAGAGAVLRYIRRSWPDITALGGDGSDGGERGGAGLAGSPFSPFPTASVDEIDFGDANKLKALGFLPQQLRSAGFSDVDIITSGFTAAELREAGIDLTILRSQGLADTALHVLGFSLEIQREALVELYSKTGGGKWMQSGGWRELMDFDLKSWGPGKDPNRPTGAMSKNLALQSLTNTLFGVATDAEGQVVKIQLVKNSLVGNSLPSKILSLSSITQLILSGNKIGGVIPDDIGLLVNLQVLYLNDNKFVGPMPNTLRKLTNLHVLRLDKNSIDGKIPPAIGCMTSLRRLVLDNNMLSGSLPMSMSQLTSLQELILNNNQLSGQVPEFLSQLRALSALNLHGNLFSSSLPDSIAVLTNLTSLTLDSTVSFNRSRIQSRNHRCKITTY